MLIQLRNTYFKCPNHTKRHKNTEEYCMENSPNVFAVISTQGTKEL